MLNVFNNSSTYCPFNDFHVNFPWYQVITVSMYDDLDIIGGVLLFEAHLCRHLYLFTSWKQKENIIVCLIMLMGVLTHSIFFCPTIKQQIILFTLSHFLLKPFLDRCLWREAWDHWKQTPSPTHVQNASRLQQGQKTQKAKTVYCFEQESKFTLPLL